MTPPTSMRIVIEIMDGDDGELIGYGVAVLDASGDYRLERSVYSVRSEAATVAANPRMAALRERARNGDPYAAGAARAYATDADLARAEREARDTDHTS